MGKTKPLYLEEGDMVKVVEGEHEGEKGRIVKQFKTNFHKQFLDIDITPDDEDARVIRKRRSDVDLL